MSKEVEPQEFNLNDLISHLHNGNTIHGDFILQVNDARNVELVMTIHHFNEYGVAKEDTTFVQEIPKSMITMAKMMGMGK